MSIFQAFQFPYEYDPLQERVSSASRIFTQAVLKSKPSKRSKNGESHLFYAFLIWLLDPCDIFFENIEKGPCNLERSEGSYDFKSKKKLLVCTLRLRSKEICSKLLETDFI